MHWITYVWVKPRLEMTVLDDLWVTAQISVLAALGFTLFIRVVFGYWWWNE